MSRQGFARYPSFEDRRGVPLSTRSSPPPPVRMPPFNSPYVKPGYTLKNSHVQQPALHFIFLFFSHVMSPRQNSHVQQPTLHSPLRPEARGSTKYDTEFSSFRHGKSSPSRPYAADLKRKTVFILHEEIRKSPSVIVLEEISDMGRITELCMTTLKSMMESKRHRKFLYHMN
ncbi:hypothetical protein BsWGS_16394 [Bradybaena similaris]